MPFENGCANSGTGIGLVFTVSNFVSEITDLSHSGRTRGALQTTHSQSQESAGSNNIIPRTFCPGALLENGELSVDILHKAEDMPPIDKPDEPIDIVYPLQVGQTTATKKRFTGFITAVEVNYNPLSDDEPMMSTITIKVSGDLVVTPSS